MSFLLSRLFEEMYSAIISSARSWEPNKRFMLCKERVLASLVSTARTRFFRPDVLLNLISSSTRSWNVFLRRLVRMMISPSSLSLSLSQLMVSGFVVYVCFPPSSPPTRTRILVHLKNKLRVSWFKNFSETAFLFVHMSSMRSSMLFFMTSSQT